MFAAVITLLLLPSAPEEILAEGFTGWSFALGWSSLPDGVTDGRQSAYP